MDQTCQSDCSSAAASDFPPLDLRVTGPLEFKDFLLRLRGVIDAQDGGMERKERDG